MPLDLVFMGTPDFAVPTLDAVLAAGHRVRAVYTRAPRPAGRGMAEQKSPVHQRAESVGIEVRTPRTLRDPAEQEAFAAVRADATVVVAYGLILPPALLAATRLGSFNLHASKLPRWRGAAPIQRAIMAGDTVTAAAIMRMEEGLDTGPVLLSEDIAIDPTMTAGALHDVLATRGAALMARALDDLEHGRGEATPQPAGGITYATKINKREAAIDFSKPATEVMNLIRGLSPFPGAWFEVAPPGGKPERIKALAATLTAGDGQPGEVLDDALTIACGSGAIRLIEVQRAGKRAVGGADFLRGFALAKGARIGSA